MQPTGTTARRLTTATLPAVALLSKSARADFALNLTPGVTPISRQAYAMHMISLSVCVVIAVIVFGFMAWSVFHHRRSRGAIAAQFHDHARLEIAWTVIPFLVLVVLAVPATRALILMDDTGNADLTIKITGAQWKWQYDYLNEGIRFVSALDSRSSDASRRGSGIDPRRIDNYLLSVDRPVVVPVGRKIRFLTTSSDVIHSWWVPALGFKKDAIPGFINEVWARIDTPGTYRGQCTELCGIGHGFMPIVVVATSDADYQTWITGMRTAQAAESASADREWTRAELMRAGEGVYKKICIACHQANGEGVPGVFKPLNGSPIANGPIADHLNRVMNGKAGTAMQAFAKQLPDIDIAAVITYERNSWGNHMGDMVQPAQVKAARH